MIKAKIRVYAKSVLLLRGRCSASIEHHMALGQQRALPTQSKLLTILSKGTVQTGKGSCAEFSSSNLDSQSKIRACFSCLELQSDSLHTPAFKHTGRH